MEEKWRPLGRRKRKRRRRADRPPLSAWLLPVDHLKGNVGVISSNFFDSLFRNTAQGREQDAGIEEIGYIAVTLWSPSARELVAAANWNVLAVKSQTAEEEEALNLDATSIQFPSSSLALQSFAQTLHNEASAKTTGRPAIEVRVLEVEPVKLDTVFVDVDGDLLDKHDEVQKKFSGGFLSAQANGFAGKGKGKAKANSRGKEANGLGTAPPAQIQDEQLKLAVREALAGSMIVRQNDLLMLPLPSHPITHVPFPPSKITLCEPVSQGIMSATTRVIVHRVRHSDLTKRNLPSVATNKALRGLQTETSDDTSNDQFYSAAENGESDNHTRELLQDSTSENESSDRDSGSSSDESLGEMISMKGPSIPTQASGALSSKTAATPRPGWPKKNGISTPGSVFSNFTSATARKTSSGKSKTFQAKCLASKPVDEILHPKPAVDEDDEARIYVDIKALLKLGCFSGDWVKVQAMSSPQTLSSRVWGLETPSEDGVHEVFKPAKIYGLPNLRPSQTPRYARGQPHERRPSIFIAPVPDHLAPAAWLSPILLSNLGHPSSVDISALLNPFAEDSSSCPAQKKSKVNTTAAPPLARELTLLRVATPLSTERALQTGLFTALKHYFEIKRRILQRGDLIALPIDVGTSRLLSSPSNAGDTDPDVEQLLSTSNTDSIAPNISLSIAWFKVGLIVAQESDLESSLSPSLWGGAASIEPLTTRMRQVGSEQCRLPATLSSTWEYYLAVKPLSVRPSFKHATSQLTAPPIIAYVTPLRRRLRELMAATTSPRALHLGMDPIFICLHSTQRNIGKARVASTAASDLGLHIFEIDAFDIVAEGTGGGDIKTEGFLRGRVDRALTCGSACTAILIRHIEVFAADRMISALKDIVREIRILIATTTEIEKVPDGIRSIFTHELEYTAPDEGEREGILQNIVQDRAIELAKNLHLSSIAVKTAALVAGNLVDIVDRASIAKQERLEALVMKQTAEDRDSPLLLRDLLVSGGEFARCIVKEDFDIAVEAARKNFADAIGAPKIPSVSWDDVGGLENVKEAVMETIQLPLERPELFAKGMKKRSGILFYGPPGTGKTLLAKAIATEFSLNFFSVKGPELLNMYIGETEANVRRVFQRARDARPCVVFFDELDSVAPKRGNQGDSGGVMDRIVSQLLAELDGMSDGDEGGGGVFVIGATNRPDLLDPALLRPGRFDKMLFLGISDTHQKQLTILEALTRKFTPHPDMSLRRVAESLPFTYTGADLYALCSDAMLKAITRQTSAIDAKIRALPGGPVTTAYFFDHLAKDEDIAVMVTEEDFGAAQKELVGSVS